MNNKAPLNRKCGCDWLDLLKCAHQNVSLDWWSQYNTQKQIALNICLDWSPKQMHRCYLYWANTWLHSWPTANVTHRNRWREVWSDRGKLTSVPSSVNCLSIVSAPSICNHFKIAIEFMHGLNKWCTRGDTVKTYFIEWFLHCTSLIGGHKSGLVKLSKLLSADEFPLNDKYMHINI